MLVVHNQTEPEVVAVVLLQVVVLQIKVVQLVQVVME